MKMNLKKIFILSAMLLCLLMLTACAAGEVLNDIEDHLEAELALTEGNAVPGPAEENPSEEPASAEVIEEPEDTVSEEPTEEPADDSASEEPAEEIEEEASEEPTEDASGEPSDDASDEAAPSDEPSEEPDDTESVQEQDATESDLPAEELEAAVKSFATDRNNIAVFHRHAARQIASEITHVVMPSRDKIGFFIPDRGSFSCAFRTISVGLFRGFAAL